MIYYCIIRWKNAAVFFIRAPYQIFAIITMWNMTSVAPLWFITMWCLKKQISIFKRKCQKIKTWSPLYFKYKELHVFIFWDLLLKMEICFFSTPPIFVHGLTFSCIAWLWNTFSPRIVKVIFKSFTFPETWRCQLFKKRLPIILC